MAPLPYSQPGARIAFDLVLGIWVLLEVRVRLSSHFNRQGTRVDRGSLWVLVALVYAGLGGGFVLATRVPSASFASASRNVRYSTVSVSRTAAYGPPTSIPWCVVTFGENARHLDAS